MFQWVLHNPTKHMFAKQNISRQYPMVQVICLAHSELYLNASSSYILHQKSYIYVHHLVFDQFLDD